MPSRAPSEKPAPGTFARFEDFLDFAGKRTTAKDQVPFFLANGQLSYIAPAAALEKLAQVRKFLSAPELLRNPTLHDGRIEVATINYQNLTQHLRWLSGLDRDSIPLRRDSGPRLLRWTAAAQLWFWSNGGPAPQGMTGTFQDWQRALDARGGRQQPAELAAGIGAMP